MHVDMEAQIHQLEQEAYCAVLRAFKAQSDAITWVLTCALFLFLLGCRCHISFSSVYDSGMWTLLQEKESLITELRKELRVSDDEHRELLNKVHGDDIIRRIRSECIPNIKSRNIYIDMQGIFFFPFNFLF